MADFMLYSYHCVDGVVRTRCLEHIEYRGPYAIRNWNGAIYHRKRSGGRYRCVRCDWERQQAQRTVDEETETT